jgi:hypothetical protein
MSERFRALVWLPALALLGWLLAAGDALAYSGPLPDPSMIGYMMGLLAIVGAALSSVLLWPIYKLRQLFRKGEPAAIETPEDATTDTPVDAAPAEESVSKS